MALPKIKFAGGGERAQYLTHSGNDTTIRFVLNYPGLIDPDVMRAAVKALVESVDILHSTFFTDANMAYWKVNRDVEEHNYFHYIRTEGDPAVTAESLSLLPVYPEDKTQLRCELVQSSNASSVVLLISHLCVDGGMGTGFENGVPEHFADTLAEIARQTNAVKEDPLAGMSGLPILHTIARGIPVWIQLSVIGKAYGAMPVGLTNLGNLNCRSLALGDLIPTGGVFGGPLKKKPGMQISIISFDGECVLACYGRYTAEDEAHIRNTMDAMARQIGAYAE